MNKSTTLPKQTRSAKIADQLRLQLNQGHFAPGQRFYSNARLAEEFDVSVPTANGIINELCRQGLVERQSGSGTYVMGKALEQPVATYGILLWGDLYNPATSDNITYEILTCFERECATQGKQAKLFNLYGDTCLDKLAAAIARGLAGVFVLLHSEAQQTQRQALEMLDAAGVPVAYWDSGHTGQLSRYPGISFDDKGAGATATRHLLTLGHRRIAFISQANDQMWESQRLDGYREAMSSAKLPKRDQVVERLSQNDLKPSDFVALFRRLQQQGVTAIVASNDSLAKELILIGSGMGIDVPEQLSVVSFDNRRDAHLLELTTIDLSADSLSRAGLDYLARAAQGDDAAIPEPLNCQLIVRESTRALREE